jgi:hypothetical protein
MSTHSHVHIGQNKVKNKDLSKHLINQYLRYERHYTILRKYYIEND